jgi:chromosome segregation protein
VHLKSLELNGFKSFVDKTAIRFQPGINGVVGPNGCGKSNVVDAMRWVMGEQSPRRLRGKGMDDVIFAGSEGRSAVGMAEVTLTFDNSDGSAPPAYAAWNEIAICRRLYRTGESEYLLNKAPCRLRDIQDFFRDTGVGTKGYTIVEQGRVAEIVSAKAEERRILIEEAAGIGKYKARRREAESKIASTEQNLLRVNDVLAEIRRQISSIERQARKAARYKRLRESQRILELSIASDERAELAGIVGQAADVLQGLRDQVTALETNSAERELAVQNKRLELAECERVLTQGSESLLALRTDIKENEGKIEFGRREREGLAELVTARKTELEELREQRASQEGEVESLAAEVEAVERAVESEKEALEKAESSAQEARGQQQALEGERDTANQTLVSVLTEVARAEDRISTIDDRRDELESRMRGTDEVMEIGQTEASRVDREQRALEEGLRNLLAERDRLMGRVKEALEGHARAVERERAEAERVQASREGAEGRRARLDSLREVLERGDDVGDGTRHLMSRDDETRRRMGIRGLVRDVIEAERDVEHAVEAVLADRAEAVVVENAEGAITAIEALRAAQAGRAVLVTTPALEPAARGVVPLGTPLLARVRPRRGCEDLARTLLDGVQLVDNLREALKVYGSGRIPATFVTPEGDLLTPDGLVRGGSGGGDGLLARSREVRDLEAALAVANHEKDLERTRERVKALGEAHEGRVVERSDLLAETEALVEERARLTESLERVRQDRATRQRELDALGLKIGSAARETARLETVATEQRVAHAGRAERLEQLLASRERATTALTETQTWMERRDQEITGAEARREELATSIDEAQTTLEARLHDEERARLSHDEKREAFERVSGEVNEFEEGLRGLRNEISAAKEKLGGNELRLRESEMKLGHLDESVREKWGVELESWELPLLELEPEPESVAGAAAALAQGSEGEAATTPRSPAERALEGAATPATDAEEAAPDAAREARVNAELARLPLAERRTKLEETRKKMQGLGEVNLGAIEEHEELGERMRFLAEQKEDLESTLASLRDAIARINRTSRKRFKETFEAVAKRFSENFPRLFRGGKASLTLTESEDVLDAGIDIMAMPPGKRLQNVNLLSGGEKTLTAIALLVAVFQVRPSPFFLLDEVDAALDDANVGRFNEIVSELATQSQFVLITHNKRTIEVSDVLYGVTMERKGVSKLVAVEMH